MLPDWLQLPHRLIPYLCTINIRAAKNGEPLVQPLYWGYPYNDAASKHRNQYLFGSQILVTPITCPQTAGAKLGRVEGWLPLGTWVDYSSGTVYSGKRELSFSRPIDEYPVFLRQGSIVPLDITEAPENGGVNPSGFEIVVVVGADGSFDILEDPADSKDSDQIVTSGKEGHIDRIPISYTQSTGRLDIGPLQSTTSTQKTKSLEWTVRLLALEHSPSDIKVQTTSSSISVQPHRDSRSTVYRIGKVHVYEKISLHLGPNPQLRKNEPLAMLEPVIKDAQVSYDDKDKLWNALIKEESLVLKINNLKSLEVDDGLKQFALECLLADAE